MRRRGFLAGLVAALGFGLRKPKPAFSLVGTETGRLSCAYPNLSNHPRDSAWEEMAAEMDGAWFDPVGKYNMISRQVPLPSFDVIRHESLRVVSVGHRGCCREG